MSGKGYLKDAPQNDTQSCTEDWVVAVIQKAAALVSDI